MSITIKDIAKIVNVSHTTVSRALNDSPLIKQETKDKIKKIAETYNYIPNYSAKSLVLSKSYNIGLFFSTLKKGTTANFFYDVITGVNNVIKDQYTLSVKGIDVYQDFHLINKRYFDGIILMSQSTNDDNFINHVINQGLPLVVLNRHIEANNIIRILSDDKSGAYKITSHLVENGHQKIAIIEGKESFKTNQQRKEGFMEALSNHQISFNPALSVKGNYDLSSGYSAMKKLLNLKDKFTAVFCFNDDMAVGAMKAIAEKNLRIPEDISIVGFDDSGYAPFLNPALTTVKRPIGKISIDGAKKLLDIIQNNKISQSQEYHVKTELVIRDSVQKIK